MKKISVFFGASVLVLGLFALAGCGQQPTAQKQTPKKQTIKPAPATGGKSASVKIVDFSFNPGEIKVAKGGKVTWTNEGTAAHTVTADNGEFDSGQLDPGKTFSQTFTTAGTFTYHCQNHPSMTGTVVVK